MARAFLLGLCVFFAAFAFGRGLKGAMEQILEANMNPGNKHSRGKRPFRCGLSIAEGKGRPPCLKWSSKFIFHQSPLHQVKFKWNSRVFHDLLLRRKDKRRMWCPCDNVRCAGLVLSKFSRVPWKRVWSKNNTTEIGLGRINSRWSLSLCLIISCQHKLERFRQIFSRLIGSQIPHSIEKYSLLTGFNPLTPKIWLLILPSSCYTFPCKSVTQIWY